MTSLPGSFISPTHSLPSTFVQSVRNNHVPPDDAPDDVAGLTPFPDRQSLIDALSTTDFAIHEIEVFSG